MKRKKAILCALASIGIMTSAGTVKANAMTMKNDTTTTKCIHKLKASEVEELLYQLPCTISTNLGKQVKQAVGVVVGRMAFDSLDEADKKRVDECAVYTLENDERLLKTVAKDEVKAICIASKIVRLEDELGYSRDDRSINKETLKNNKEDIPKIKEKMMSIEKDYQGISDYSIKYSPKLESLMSDLYQMEIGVMNSGLN